jgi:hypothetical protein
MLELKCKLLGLVSCVHKVCADMLTPWSINVVVALLQKLVKISPLHYLLIKRSSLYPAPLSVGSLYRTLIPFCIPHLQFG